MNTLIKRPGRNASPSLFVVKGEPVRAKEQDKKAVVKINKVEKPVYPQIIMPVQPVAYLKAKRHDPL